MSSALPPGMTGPLEPGGSSGTAGQPGGSTFAGSTPGGTEGHGPTGTLGDQGLAPPRAGAPGPPSPQAISAVQGLLDAITGHVPARLAAAQASARRIRTGAYSGG